jgi:uncharacterized protein YndB with AHSA1/START domain
MTDHATTANLDDVDQDYRSELTLKASADVVFDALTTIEGLANWWTAVTGNGLTGGELTFSFGPSSDAVMRVDAAEPGACVRWTTIACHVEDWVGTTVNFELAAISTGDTELRFRHAGLTPRLECYADCQSGWDHFIASLRDYVETGVGHPNQSAEDLARREAREQRRTAANVD